MSGNRKQHPPHRRSAMDARHIATQCEVAAKALTDRRISDVYDALLAINRRAARIVNRNPPKA